MPAASSLPRALALALLGAPCALAFSPANLLALRVASASGACPSGDVACSRAEQVYLDEYDISQLPTFALVTSVPVAGVTLSSTDFYLGQLTACADGSCVMFAAGTDVAGAPTLTGRPYLPGARVIVRIAQDGTVDTTTHIAASDYDGIIRGVCSFDGSGYWVVGNASAGCVGYVRHGVPAGAAPAAGGYTTVASGANCVTAEGSMAGHYTSCVASFTNELGGRIMADRSLLFARSFNNYGFVDVAMQPASSWTAAGGLQLSMANQAQIDSGYSDATYFSQMLGSRVQDNFWMLDPSPGTCGVAQCYNPTPRGSFPYMTNYYTNTGYDHSSQLSPTSCSWPTNLSNVQCFGLTFNPATTAAACAAAACALKLEGWQFLGPNRDGCWIGPTGGPGTCRDSPNPWVGGGLPWTSSTLGCRTLFTFADICDYSGFALSRDEGTLYISVRRQLYAHASKSGGGGVFRYTLAPDKGEFRGVAVAPGWCDRTGRSPFDGFYCPNGANSTAFRCPSGNYSLAGATKSCPLALPTPSPTPTSSVTPSASATPTQFNPDKPCWAASTLAGADYVTPNYPRGLAFDKKAGAVLVADAGLSEITRVTPSSSLPWVGSSGVRGCADGTGTAALFWTPNGVAISDTSGDTFVTDGHYHVIRRISPAGAVTTAVGACGQKGYIDGDVAIARLNSPFALAIDSTKDRLYFSDNADGGPLGGNVIRYADNLRGEIVVSTLCGIPPGSSSIDGVGTASRFNWIPGMAIDTAKQVLYASDYWNQRIRMIDLKTGTVTTIAGGSAGIPTNTVATNIQFANPTGLALDATGKTLFIADTNNAVIRALDMTDPTGFSATVYAGDGDFTNGVIEGVGTSAKLPFVAGLTVDPASGDLYASLTVDATIVKITRTGAVSIFAGVSRPVDGRGLNARFGHISSMLVDAADNILVADSEAHSVRKVLTATGVVSTLAGAAPPLKPTPGFADGVGAAARFNVPVGLALGAPKPGGGTLYVSDAQNHAIRAVDLATLKVSTVAGGQGAPGQVVDGAALTAARLSYPAQMAWFKEQLFFLDCVNLQWRFNSPPLREGQGDKFRVLDLATGAVRTLGDSAGTDFFNFGRGMSTVVAEPATGFIYFADFWNGRVHKWANVGGPTGSFSYVTQPNWPVGLAFDVNGAAFGTPGALLASRWGIEPWGSWGILRYNMPSALNNPANGDTPLVGLGDAFGSFNPGSHDGLFGNASAFQGAVAMQPGAIAIDSKGHVFVSHEQHDKIVRIGRLKGQACSFAVPADSPAHVCHPGAFIDWDAKTCRPCPPSASVDVFPFSSYCQDPLGNVINSLDVATTVGASVGAIVGGVLAAVALLAGRAYYVINSGNKAPPKGKMRIHGQRSQRSPRGERGERERGGDADDSGPGFEAIGVRQSSRR
jgi:hypothetical protein